MELWEAAVKTHLHREVEQLKTQVLGLGAQVEESLRNAVVSVIERNAALADAVIRGDDSIDRLEVDIEEDCLQILALYQPVASDLRFIVAVLKLNNDLERIGDLAVNIAQRSRQLADLEPIPIPFDFQRMASRVEDMVRRSLDAIVNLDAAAARGVCAADEEIDQMHRGVYQAIQESIQRDPAATGVLIPMLVLARHLERVADHATNIAEDVIYTVEGRIARHLHPGGK
jgi:phosphate transport system protein